MRSYLTPVSKIEAGPETHTRLDLGSQPLQAKSAGSGQGCASLASNLSAIDRALTRPQRSRAFLQQPALPQISPPPIKAACKAPLNLLAGGSSNPVTAVPGPPIQRELVPAEPGTYTDTRNPGLIFRISSEHLQPVTLESGEVVPQNYLNWMVPGIELVWNDKIFLYLPETLQYLMEDGCFLDVVSGNILRLVANHIYQTEDGSSYAYDGSIYHRLERDAKIQEELNSFDDEPTKIQEELNSLGDESTNVLESSPEELGLQAAEEIGNIATQAKSLEDISCHFGYLVEKYGLQDIAFHGSLEKPPITVWFKINPEFEVSLSGGHAVEMRSEGTGSGTTNATSTALARTKVKWTPGNLSISPSTGQPPIGPFRVGETMEAEPLSQDHVRGSEAAADSDHTGMMSQLPSLGHRASTGSGSGSYYFIKGHLLNDNLGGVANEANLYPITNEANGQHKNFVEQYIKKGVAQGYVYSYWVKIQKKGEGYDVGISRYWVNADLNFGFARLDTSGNPISSTKHEGTIESRYTTTGAVPFTKTTEYAADYTGGSYNNPKAVGGEMTLKTTEQSPVTSNSSLKISNVSTFGMASTTSSIMPTTSAQTINSSAPQVAVGNKLSLRQSNLANIVTHYSALVANWSATDITNFHSALGTTTSWAGVSMLAQAHNLDPTIANTIFASGSIHTVRISINGAPVNT